MKTYTTFFIYLAISVAAFAQTAKTRTAINTQIDSQLASSTGITAATLRGLLKDFAASVQFPLTDANYQPADASLLAYAQAVDAAARRDLIGAAAATHTHALSALTQSGATTGQVATWNGSAWAPATPSSGGGTGDMLRSTYDANTDGIIDAAALPNSWASLTITGALNVPAGAVSDAAIATTIARDSEVTAAVAAETSARGTAITAAIAQEVTDRNAAISASVNGISAGSLPIGMAVELPTGMTPASTFLLANGSNGTTAFTAHTGFTAYQQGTGVTVSTPTFDPAAGTYASAQSVALNSTTVGATIRYTTDGSAPSRSVGTVYSTAIPVSASSTIRAIAYKDFSIDSALAQAVYTISAPTGTFAWAMESTTAGTGSGDTTATLTGATLSSAQAYAGTQSLYCSGAAWQYAEFSTGATANPDYSMQEGTLIIYVRWTGTWTGNTYLAVLSPNSGSGRVALITQSGVQGQVQLAYRGSNNSSTTMLATGLTSPDTWYKITAKWRSSASPYLSLQFDEGTATTSANTLAAVTESPAKIEVGNFSAGVCTTFYLDNLSLSTTW